MQLSVENIFNQFSSFYSNFERNSESHVHGLLYIPELVTLRTSTKYATSAPTIRMFCVACDVPCAGAAFPVHTDAVHTFHAKQVLVGGTQ